MSTRQRLIAKALLEVLNSLEGTQLNETVLHAEVVLRMSKSPSLAEFKDGLSICDANGWVVGVSPKFGGAMLWNITDAGQAARLQIN